MNYLDALTSIKKVDTWLNTIKESDFHSTLILCRDTIIYKEIAKLLLIYKFCDKHCHKCSTCLKIINETAIDINYYPKSKSFVVGDANDIIENLSIKPFEFKNKYYILNEFDKANIQTQNKLLKTLEEPSPSSKFLIFAKSTDGLLPTIISRVAIIKFPKIEFEDILSVLVSNNLDANNNKYRVLFALSNNSVTKFLENINNEQVYNNYLEIIDFLQDFNTSASILKYSNLFSSKYKDLKEYFFIISKIFDNIINDSKLENMNKLKSIYSIEMINLILNSMQKCLKDLEMNVNQTTVLDKFLIDILEVKYKCKK